MKTKMRPCGVTLEIEHEGKTYYGHLYNDWEKYKTYENYEIDPFELNLFDENFDRIPYDDDLYDTMSKLIEEHILEYKHSFEDEENEE